MKKSISFIYTKGTALCQRVSAGFVAPSEKQGRAVMFVLAVALIVLSLSLDASAQSKYNDQEIDGAVNAVMLYLEGSLGALIMAAAVIAHLVTVLVVFPIVAFTVTWWWGVLCLFFPGPATIAFSIVHFKKALLPLVIAMVTLLLSVGVFILRGFLMTFFVEAPV